MTSHHQLSHSNVPLSPDWRHKVIFGIAEFARIRAAADLKFHFSSEDAPDGITAHLSVAANFSGNVLSFQAPQNNLEAKLRFLGLHLFSNEHVKSFILTSGDVLVKVDRSSYSKQQMPETQQTTMLSMTLEGVTPATDSEQTWQHLVSSFARCIDRASAGIRVHTDLEAPPKADLICIPTKVGKLWLDPNARSGLPVRVVSRINGLPIQGMSIFGVRSDENLVLLDAVDKSVPVESLAFKLAASPLSFRCLSPTSTIVINDHVYSAWVAHADRLLAAKSRDDLLPIGNDVLVDDVFPGSTTSKAKTEHYSNNFVVSDYTGLDHKVLVARLRADKTVAIADAWESALARVLSSEYAQKLGFHYNPKLKTKWMYHKRPLFFGFAVAPRGVTVHTSTLHGCFIYRINPVVASSKSLIYEAAQAVALSLDTDPLAVTGHATKLARSGIRVIN